MVKFLAESNQGKLIGLGLSRENLRLLEEGQPIPVYMKDLGFPDGIILLFFGETEGAIAEGLAGAGLLPEGPPG